VTTCLLDGTGLAILRDLVAELLGEMAHGAPEPHAVISERHREILIGAQGEVSEALALVSGSVEEAVVLAVCRLRAALERLGTATGRQYQEELLDAIFSRFCVGK
jgi:tRNA modification GTPase